MTLQLQGGADSLLKHSHQCVLTWQCVDIHVKPKLSHPECSARLVFLPERMHDDTLGSTVFNFLILSGAWHFFLCYWLHTVPL